MIAKAEAGEIAEALIVSYAKECGVQSPDDISKVMEMLISKSARAIEKYCGTAAASNICARTAYSIESSKRGMH